MTYAPEDHQILSDIAEAFDGEQFQLPPEVSHFSRESECIEFYDSDEDAWFEIVVRRLRDGSESAIDREPSEDEL